MKRKQVWKWVLAGCLISWVIFIIGMLLIIKWVFYCP